MPIFFLALELQDIEIIVKICVNNAKMYVKCVNTDTFID